jgi:hypothetical protein
VFLGGDGEEGVVRLPKALRDRFSELAKAPGVSLPPSRRRPRAPKVTVKEKDLQAMAENLCLARGIRFFRLPDSLLGYLARCPDAWIRVFVSRYLAGLPDLLLFKPRPEGDNIVRFIEIKTEAGKVHQSQAKWHSGMNVHVCHGWQETQAAILGFEAAEPPAASAVPPLTPPLPNLPRNLGDTP